MPWGLDLPLKPFFGVMGTSPPPAWGRITSLIPRAMGGNLDNKELGAGLDAASVPVVINFNSNIDPMKLRRGVAPRDEPEDGT